MENKKQSSIDWLVEQISYQMDIRIENTTIGCDLFEQAKAMHKEEIIEAYNESFRLRDKPYSTAIKYYNETFGEQDE